MSERKPEEQRISSVPPFGLRMLPDLRQRIEDAARDNGRSMNAEIIARLEGSFDLDRDTDPPAAPKIYASSIGAIIDKFTEKYEALVQKISDKADLIEAENAAMREELERALESKLRGE